MSYRFSLVRFTAVQLAVALGVSIIAYLLQVYAGYRVSGWVVSVVPAISAAMMEGQRQARRDGALLARPERLRLGNWMLLGTLITSGALIAVSVAMASALGAQANLRLLLSPLTLGLFALFFFFTWLLLPWIFANAAKSALQRERGT